MADDPIIVEADEPVVLSMDINTASMELESQAQLKAKHSPIHDKLVAKLEDSGIVIKSKPAVLPMPSDPPAEPRKPLMDIRRYVKDYMRKPVSDNPDLFIPPMRPMGYLDPSNDNYVPCYKTNLTETLWRLYGPKPAKRVEFLDEHGNKLNVKQVDDWVHAHQLFTNGYMEKNESFLIGDKLHRSSFETHLARVELLKLSSRNTVNYVVRCICNEYTEFAEPVSMRGTVRKCSRCPLYMELGPTFSACIALKLSEQFEAVYRRNPLAAVALDISHYSREVLDLLHHATMRALLIKESKDYEPTRRAIDTRTHRPTAADHQQQLDPNVPGVCSPDLAVEVSGRP